MEIENYEWLEPAIKNTQKGDNLKCKVICLRAQIIREVHEASCEYEKTDENYDKFMMIIKEIKKDPMQNIICIDELEELYNDRTNANRFFFKSGFDFAIKTLLHLE